MKSRFPICWCSATLGAATYITFTILAYSRYPLPFSPLQNWLSDLGNQIDNPQGAIFYNTGVILTALLLGAWFVGLSKWRLTNNVAHQRLLAIAQVTGILSIIGLIMSALNPINMPEVHSFWSQIHFILSGIAFGFSVTALRYHTHFSNRILYLGIGSAALPFLMYTFGEGRAYWMEWIAVALFILYILSVGNRSRTFMRYA